MEATVGINTRAWSPSLRQSYLTPPSRYSQDGDDPSLLPDPLCFASSRLSIARLFRLALDDVIHEVSS